MSAITTPAQLTQALPAIVSDLTNLNTTLAPLGAILGVLAPPAVPVVPSVTVPGVPAVPTVGTGGTGTGTGGNNGGLLCGLSHILRRQTGAPITGLGDLDDITNVLTPLVQILSSVLNAVTSLVGINSEYNHYFFKIDNY